MYTRMACPPFENIETSSMAIICHQCVYIYKYEKRYMKVTCVFSHVWHTCKKHVCFQGLIRASVNKTILRPVCQHKSTTTTTNANNHGLHSIIDARGFAHDGLYVSWHLMLCGFNIHTCFYICGTHNNVDPRLLYGLLCST